MPNIINANGLTTKTQEEMDIEISQKLRNIYGNDINLSSDSPDGQNKNIFILTALDQLELIIGVYNSMDPDKAAGVVLDSRVKYNGIQRKGGTFTVLSITVVTSDPVVLYGLDQTAQDIFTVADDQNNEFQLGETVSLSVAGTYSLVFQAAESGKVEVLPDTITNAVTVVLGVVSVNNPNPPISVGIDEETDPQLRMRRQKSTSLPSSGYVAALEAALLNVNGVTDARVYENDTNQNPDANGVPAHSIWVIVAGVYSQVDVARAIYTKRGTGAGMRGVKTYVITEQNGSTFVARWDDVALENLFIKLVIEPIDPALPIDINLIRNKLPDSFESPIGGTVNVNEIACMVQTIDSNALVTDAGLSLLATGPFTPKLSNSARNKKFVLLSENVIITPVVIYPLNLTAIGGVDPAGRTLLAYGGYGAYTWSIDDDNSGGATIDANGFYTPGTTNQDVVDVVKVTDSQGNVAFANIEVS